MILLSIIHSNSGYFHSQLGLKFDSLKGKSGQYHRELLRNKIFREKYLNNERVLETDADLVDNVEDDDILYNRTNENPNLTLDQKMFFEGNSALVFDGQDNLDLIKKKLERIRKFTHVLINPEMKASAIGIYIEEAVLLNKKGLLDDEEGIQEVSVDDLKEEVHKEEKHSLDHMESEHIKEERDLTTEHDTDHSEKNHDKEQDSSHFDDAEHHEQHKLNEKERRLLLDNRKLNKKAKKTYHPDIVAKLRRNNEMLELAKTGKLFDIDLDNVYELGKTDFDKFKSIFYRNSNGHI